MPARKDAASQEPGASRRRSTSTSGGSNDRQVAEEALTLSHRFLEIANRHSAKVPLLEELVAEVQRYTGCPAVGIRMLDEEGNIPYEAYTGFSERFYELESPLSIESDKCMCINVIRGQADPKLPFYTEGGSFFMNGTTRFLATVSEDEKGETRNACNEFGYESVALIPIRLVGRIMGVIHVADTREDMVPRAMVEVLEGTAAQLGTAIQRVQAEEALRTQRDKFEGIIASLADGLDIVSRDYRVHFQNEMLKDRFGDLTGKLCYEGYMGRETPCEACPMDKAIATGSTQTVEMTAADGRQYEVTATPFQDIDGETKVVEVCRDISERKRAEEALRQSQDQLSAVVDNMPGFVSILDGNLKVRYVNRVDKRLEGMDVVGGKASRFVSPKDRERHDAALRSFIERDNPKEIDVDATLGKTFHLRFARLGDRVLVVGDDITDRKLAEEKLRESRDYLETLTNSMWDAVFSVRMPERLIEWANDSFKLIGYEPEECIGRTTEFLYPDKGEFLDFGKKLGSAIAAGEDVLHAEQLLRRKNGEAFPAELTTTAYREQGKVVSVTSIVRDITERKQAEEALRLAAGRWQTTFDGVADAVCLLDADARIVQCNRAMGEMAGEQPAECVGRNCCELVHGSPHHLEGCPLVSMRSSLRRETLELAVGQRWLQVTVDPLTDQAGGLTGAVHVVSDISERKRAEEELRGSEQQYRRIVETSLEGIWIIDSDSNTEFVNPRMAEMLGYTVEEMKGAPLFTFMDEEGKAKAARNVERRRQGIREVHEFRFCRKDGSDLYALASTNPLFDEDGQYAGALAMVADITERKRAEEALRRSEERYRDLVEGVDYLVTQVDGEGKFIFVNHAASKVFGLEPRQCTGLSAFDFVHPDDRDRTKEAFAGWVRDHLSSVTFENRMVSQSGQVRDLLWTVALHFDDAGEVAAINSIAHDITERKRAEEEQRRLEQRVQQAQKLESLGLLAGGIAHDFNNLLVSVLGNADLVLRDMPGVAPGRAGVEEIKKAAIRASELTGQMLAYSGRGRFVVEPVDLSEVVREMGRLLKASISKNATLRYELTDDLPAVEADAAQLRQVAMNLITNASEAVGDEGGTITVRTGIIDVGRAYLAATDLGEGLPEGPYLFLEVSDTGRGMDAETRARLFDPFFSTKFTGRGLGLAAVLGIVRGHKGTIRVYSEPGQGTTFKVLLPFSDRPAEKADKPAAPVEADWHGRGTVLVIDDEPAVRNVARMMLERAGLTVLTASDGQAGVELFGRHRDEIDAVLLDLTMPRMSGEETLQRLRRIRKDVPVILSSGFGEQDATSRFSGDRLAGFIQKPFELAVLVGQFRRVMEPRPAGREEA